MIYVGNYLCAWPAALCSSAVSLQAGPLSAEPRCRPFTSISRDCSNCCTRICRPLNLICNVGAAVAALPGNLEICQPLELGWGDECGSVLRTVSRDIEVFVSWHQEILICKYLRSSCCTFPHIITLSSQQSTFKHFCHTQLSRLRYLHSTGRSPVSSFIKIYKSPALCGVQSSLWEKAWSKHPLFYDSVVQSSKNLPSCFEVNWTILRIDHQEG